MIDLNNFNFKILLPLFLSFTANFSLSQSSEDLEFLRLLPDSQAQSISEKLGIQTGKPLVDTIKMEDFDDPLFESSKPKEDEEEFSQENQELELVDGEFPIFGLDLFKDAPTTFAPIDLSPAPLDYVLGPGDELRIQLYGAQVINRLVPVTREGNIVLPEVGPVQVSGLTFNEARSRINDAVSASLI